MCIRHLCSSSLDFDLNLLFRPPKTAMYCLNAKTTYQLTKQNGLVYNAWRQTWRPPSFYRTQSIFENLYPCRPQGHLGPVNMDGGRSQKADHPKLITTKERQLLTPVKRAEGPKDYVRPPFLFPSQTFNIWAPHGPKFLHVNPT